MTSQDTRLRELYVEWLEDEQDVSIFLQTVAREFGWSISEAYTATEFLFRPENTN
jgi:hypothetical protein